MAFTPPGAQTPTKISRLTVVLTDRLATGNEPASQTATYELVLVDQNGARIAFPRDTGTLIPHLTAGQITALQSFMADLRELAESQILEA